MFEVVAHFTLPRQFASSYLGEIVWPFNLRENAEEFIATGEKDTAEVVAKALEDHLGTIVHTHYYIRSR